MQVDTRSSLQRLGRRKKGKLHVHSRRTLEQPGRSQHHSAFEFVPFDSGQIDGGAFASERPVSGASMNLDAASANSLRSWEKLELIFLADCPGNQGAGDHSPETFHGENAVDWQAGDSAGISCRNFSGDSHQLAPEFVEACVL